MASTSSFLHSTKDDLTCPVCLFLFVDPRVPKQLNCPHTYCKLCLEQLLPKSPRPPIVPCPECRKCTTVPERNASNLPTNVRLQSLAEKYKQHAEKQQSTVPVCSEHDGKSYIFTASHVKSLSVMLVLYLLMSDQNTTLRV